MNLIQDYDAAIHAGKIKNAPNQRALLPYFQQVLDNLQKPVKKKSGWFSSELEPVQKGIYLHGNVGSGKTFLMDLLYYHLLSPHKARYHFHHFMQQVDGQLRHLQGRKDPLRFIAQNLALRVRLLCLDEMLVQDVAHAMILAELLQVLFEEGVIVIITANTAPDNLYKQGIQRQRFLPAIGSIKKHCEVLFLESEHDYRLHMEPFYQAYNYPLNTETLQKQFEAWGGTIQPSGEIIIQNRAIPYVLRTEKTIWFEFKALCDLPRSQLDYLEIVQHFTGVVLSHVPHLEHTDSAQAILLMHLVDVFYDSKIQLMISAATSLDKLLDWEQADPGFKRIYSRLKEMQGVGWALAQQLNFTMLGQGPTYALREKI